MNKINKTHILRIKELTNLIDLTHISTIQQTKILNLL